MSVAERLITIIMGLIDIFTITFLMSESVYTVKYLKNSVASFISDNSCKK